MRVRVNLGPLNSLKLMKDLRKDVCDGVETQKNCEEQCFQLGIVTGECTIWAEEEVDGGPKLNVITYGHHVIISNVHEIQHRQSDKSALVYEN